MESVLTKEAAEKELNEWLDFHEISEETRVAFAGNIAIIVRGLMSGRISIANNALTQKLKHPTNTTNALTYKAGGLAIGEVENNKTNIHKDYDRRGDLAHIAVATNTSTDILLKISTQDLNTATAIIIFFMV